MTKKKKKYSSKNKTILLFIFIFSTLFATHTLFYGSQKIIDVRSHASELTPTPAVPKVCGNVDCSRYQTQSACNQTKHTIMDSSLVRIGSNKDTVCIWNAVGGCFKRSGYPQTLVRVVRNVCGPAVWNPPIIAAPGSACENQLGVCSNINKAGCSKKFKTSLCPGTSNIQCCKGQVVQ